MAIVLQAIPGETVEEHRARATLHRAIMELVEPELERAAMARSAIAALRQTVADLQRLVRQLAAPAPALIEFLRDMPLDLRQALNVHMAAAIGRAGSLARGIDDAQVIALEWIACHVERIHNIEPKKRREVA